MSRLFTHGNGNMLVCLDQHAQVRDLYYPYVGLENHVSGHHVHRIGVFVEGKYSWLSDGGWHHETDCSHDDIETCGFVGTNEGLGVKIALNDVVYNEKNIFIREVMVHNLRDYDRDIKIFFSQQFEISETHRGDTAYFDPRCQSIIHYKGRRAFLINAQWKNKSFDDYTVGIFEIEGREGSHIDAQDGTLHKNPIEHGSVDSVIGLTLRVEKGTKEVFHYWVALGESIREVQQLNSYLLRKSPQHLIKTTRDYWTAWVNRRTFSFHGLSKKTVRLFKHSMLIIRSHVGDNGSIIASGDTDLLQHGRGTYSYMWPRDGAFTANALDRVGSFNASKRFFQFCNDVITDEGYFMHKYRPDGSLGSSWHPWIRQGNPELPIQEDETAVILWALWQHYEETKDLEFVEEIYNSLIERAADFLVHYTYKDTGLPYPSYDLWEEKYGITTYTTASIYGALHAAANFAALLGKEEKKKLYQDTAERMKEAIIKNLYNEELGMFVKLINFRNGEVECDRVIDMSSFFGVVRFGVLPHDHKLVKTAIKTIEEQLCLKNGITGVPRYVGDNYFRQSKDMPPNPWFITTLWLAQYYIMEAKSEKDLDIVKEIFNWVSKYALSTGILSEQLHPFSGKQLSATPLTWSHAEFLITVLDYLEKLEELGIAQAVEE